jgi:uncharacterized protein (TIGR02118 family)
MARVVVMYRTPKDAAAFDKYYFEHHVPIAKKIAGLRKYEVSRGPVAAPAGASGIHLVARRPSPMWQHSRPAASTCICSTAWRFEPVLVSRAARKRRPGIVPNSDPGTVPALAIARRRRA